MQTVLPPPPWPRPGLDTGDTAWLLAATALVLLMTPGLALFYGGMVRTKSVLNMLMMSFVSIALVTVVWLVAGYSLAFGDDAFAGLIGGLGHVGMVGIGPDDLTGSVPTLLFTTFQLTFAILTAALISGAIADRMKFAAWLVFVPVWTLLVYVPVAHWVWGPGRLDRGLPRCPGLRGRPGRGDHLRGVGSRPGPGDRPAHRLQEGRDAAAQPADGDARRRPALVRLARLQRRLGARRRTAWRPPRSSTPWSPDAPACSAGSSWSSGATVTRPPSARPRVWSRAWSRSLPRAERSACRGPPSSDSRRVSSARTPSRGSSASTTTTPSTSSVCTSWAASSARCSSGCSRRPR